MVCPICTIAVGTGVGVLRAYGVDDLISGLWIGALIVSCIFWTLDFLNKKNLHFIFKKSLVSFGFYAIFIIPLYYLKIIGIQGNTFLGIDKILLGIIAGSIVFLLSIASDNYLRKNNNGKVLFPYQKVIVPLAYLIAFSIIIHLLLEVGKW